MSLITNGYYKQIPTEIHQQLSGQEMYSIESMSGHDAADRKISYVGSILIKNKSSSDRCTAEYGITDYFVDSTGSYWYDTRYKLSDGEIIGDDVFIFGRPMPRWNHWREKEPYKNFTPLYQFPIKKENE